MKSLPNVRRWLIGLTTAAVFAAILAVTALSHGPADAKPDDAPAASSNWTMFGGTVQRNLVNTFEKNVPTDWNVEKGQEKNIKWSVPLGDKAYGGPVVADGKVFVGTNNKNPRNPRDVDPGTKAPLDKGIVMCFNEADGKFLWQAVHDKLQAGRVNDWPEEGICSTPVVEGKRLYYVSNRCEVICADTEGFLDAKNDGFQEEKYKDKTDADIIWRYDMMTGLNVFPHNLATCSPLILGDNLYVITSNGVDEGHINIPQPKAPSFICLGKKDGKVKWQSNLPSVKLLDSKKSLKELVDAGEVLMHGQWSNPVAAVVEGKPQVIFPGGNGWVYSFEPESGELLWKFDCNPKKSFYELGGKGTRSDFVSTPVVWENKLYIGVGQDPEHKEGIGHLWCIDCTKKPANADKDVSPVNDNFDPKAPENKNSALVWHYGGPGKSADGRRNYLFGRTLSTCSINDGILYTGELAGYVHCLDARTGQKYWEHNFQASTWSSPYCVDGKVYFGNDNGIITIFKQGKKKEIVAEIDMGEPVRATPVVANGVLYVMTENKLYAIK
jgi:outer membrane protein assembly factor BamB